MESGLWGQPWGTPFVSGLITAEVIRQVEGRTVGERRGASWLPCEPWLMRWHLPGGRLAVVKAPALTTAELPSPISTNTLRRSLLFVSYRYQIVRQNALRYLIPPHRFLRRATRRVRRPRLVAFLRLHKAQAPRPPDARSSWQPIRLPAALLPRGA